MSEKLIITKLQELGPLTLAEITTEIGGFDRTNERILNGMIGKGLLIKRHVNQSARAKMLKGVRGKPPCFYMLPENE